MASKLTIATESDVKTLIKSLRTWFSVIASSPKSISYATRDNGNVRKETHGHTDFEEALRIKKALEERYSNICVTVAPNDEWVCLDVYIYSKPVTPRPQRKDPEKCSWFEFTMPKAGIVRKPKNQP